MSQLRKIVFYFFLGLYLIICPITILYALGYIVKPGAYRPIVKTGMIYLSTAPSGATVYLENKRFTHKTPAVLRDLVPGEYTVNLVLKDHQPWKKTLSVEAERATVLERILMLPDEFHQKQIAEGPYERLIPVPETRYLLAVKGRGLNDLFVYDMRLGEMRQLMRSSAADGEWLDCLTVLKSTRLLLHVKSGGEKKWLWLDLKDKFLEPQDLTSFFPETSERIQWDPERENAIFYLDGQELKRLDIALGNRRVRTIEPVRGYGLFEKAIYTLKPGGTFTRLGLGVLGDEVLLRDPLLANALFGEAKNFDIRLFSKDVIFFLGPQGELLSNRLPYRFAESGIRGVQFNSKHERALVWSKKQIGFIDFSKEPEEEKVFERGPELFWIFHKGKEIEEVFPVYEASLALFQDGDRAMLLELETYGRPYVYDLTQVKKGSSLVYTEEQGGFYYVTEQGRLMFFELLPKLDLLAFPFPEWEGKKKKTKPEEIF